MKDFINNQKDLDPEYNKIIEENFWELTDDKIESPYCPVCDGCGEDGCCSAMNCKQHPDGSYCQTYLMELQFAYRMYHQLMELIDGDEKYKEQVDKIWNETYDYTFKSE